MCLCIDPSHSASMETIQEDCGGDSGGSCGGWNHIGDISKVGDTNNGGRSNIITGGNGLKGSEPPYPTRNGTIDEHGVPPFLIKLYEMVDDKATDSIISWGSSSITFIISDEPRFISEILPCYFKNNRFDTFTYQLNIYGFKKKEWNPLEFEHKHFRQGQQHLLKNIKRQKSQNQRLKAINNTETLTVAISELEATFTEVRHTHKQIINKIHRVKDDIQKTLSEVKSIIKDKSRKLISTFSQGRKRKLVDINLGIYFGDVEKDFESMYGQFEVSMTHIDSFMTLSDLTNKIANEDTNSTGGGGGGGGRVPQFLQKLYNMVEKEEIDSFISWNLPHRDSFIIRDINKFATQVLPMYFSHTNFSSFNTQLNIYGFRKVRWERYEYANEWFRGGRHDLLANIKRRDKNLILNRSSTKFSFTQVQMFKDQLQTIQQEQENKIIYLSKYEEQIKNSVHEFKKAVVNMANIVNKMILESDENLENVKKAKLEIEDKVIEGQDLDVDEPVGNNMASINNNNVEAQAYFLDIEMDIEAMGKNMEMEDVWIIEREMEKYSSLCLGTESEMERKFSFNGASCS
ncbi:hypothetical protein L2E82_31269 [Cichorium intybus]|uniref:Uncharacterized protein n=1 Tax=Cichorium intybus TaxID=13427 RepID=A0ACB9D2Y3_CICIN|nr:hypothetical protein L2E82_31269 [Cichorium intybus]